jgi:3-hydroxyacyl-CoA dehydrogenase
VYVTGYGFPAERGGPMYLADQIGLASVHEDVKRFHEAHGVWWEPAPLLARLAKEGGRFGR